MAIYGFGTTYENNRDVHLDFIENNIASIGWTQSESVTLHNILGKIKIGDIVYLKTFNPKTGLIIKAIGIVTDDQIQEHPSLGWGICVNWRWTGKEKYGLIKDKYPVHSFTIFEELNPEIQNRIVDLFMME